MNQGNGHGVAGYLSEELENWMTNLPEDLKLVPIIELAIPGSHDSFTANISIKSDIAPDAEDIIKALKILGPLVKYFIINWSRTQTYMATDQLIRGIRYFDLRLATKKDSSDIFIVHGLYSDNIQTIFNDIVLFLDSHPQEVVLLDCQHFYAFDDTDHDKLIRMLGKTFGVKLLPYSQDMDYITLDYMTNQHKYQVIVIYRSDRSLNQPLLWPSESFPNPWPDTSSASELFPALDKGIKSRSAAFGYITQCILTPNFCFIFKNLLGTLKEKCAIDLEEQKLEWIDKQKSGPKGMNIIISDYIELSDCAYVRKVINLNEALRKNRKKHEIHVNVEPMKNTFHCSKYSPE